MFYPSGQPPNVKFKCLHEGIILILCVIGAIFGYIVYYIKQDIVVGKTLKTFINGYTVSIWTTILVRNLLNYK